MLRRFVDWIRGVLGWERYDLYLPSERRIYSFFDGYKTLHADPMVLYKRIMDVGPELSVMVKVANSAHKDARSEYDKLITRLREIFNLKTPDAFAMDKGGLNEEAVMELFDHFMTYIGLQKKSLKTPPTSPMVTPPPFSPSLDASQPTQSGLASGLTEDAYSTAEPVLSPTAVPLPSDSLSPTSVSSGQ